MREPLESRIAPALGSFHLSPDRHSAFYDDIDGDHVTVKISVGELADANPGGTLRVEAGPHGDGSGQLRFLDLSAARFNLANITFSVVRVPGGDGLANVGAIFGGTNDFGKIVIKGDLEKIDAGSNTPGIPAIKSLTVRSMGLYDMETQATDTGFDPSGSSYFVSTIMGGLGSLNVARDVKGVSINVIGENGGIGSIIIGGSLIGGNALAVPPVDLDQHSGVIFCSSDIRVVKIGGDVRGGDARGNVAPLSGAIVARGNLLSVNIGGSLVGGAGPGSGFLFSELDMGTVKIARNVVGGTETGSGLIQSMGKLAALTIGGSVIGGSADDTGEILVDGDVGTVKIGHDLIGGSITGSASLSRTGYLVSTGGRIGAVTVGGSILSGIDTSSGSLSENASIRAGHDLGSLTVKGDIAGNIGDGSPANISPVYIVARGQSAPHPGTDLALGKLTVGGTVSFARILAGYQTDLSAVNGDAQIGVVKINGDWVSSNLVAGAKNTASNNTIFGDGHETSIGSGNSATTARIASIVIHGEILGSPGGATFGFVAEQIGSFRFNGTTLLLAPDAHTDEFGGVGLVGSAKRVGPSLSPTLSDGFAVHVFEV